MFDQCVPGFYSLTYACNHGLASRPSRIGVGWPSVIRFKASTMKMQALFHRIYFTSTVQSTLQLSQSLATAFCDVMEAGS